MPKNKVVITGIGLITPIGNSCEENWDSVISGESGISKFETKHDLGHASPVAGQVNNIQEKISLILSPKEISKTSRFIQLALVAAKEAIDDSGLQEDFPKQRNRFGTYVGVGIGGVNKIEEAAFDFASRGYKSISPFILPSIISNEASAWVSMKFNLQGPNMAIVNACSSSTDAVGLGFRSIKDGYSDFMLVGGTESALTPLTFAGFGNMRALSSWKGDPSKASRPFDKDRTGFVLSEGAGFIILENEESARKRGAKIYSEIVGYGSTSDAYHITAIHPEGRGAIDAIDFAINEAKADKEKIGYINAHGTATLMNDPSETKIIKFVFGEHCGKNNPDRLLVSSTKSMTGHMLGAAGSVEVAYTSLAIKRGVLPPTINLENPDSLCDLDYIPNHAREKNLEFAMSTSFGFGGANSVIILKKT